jgi:hypothetical protein
MMSRSEATCRWTQHTPALWHASTARTLAFWNKARASRASRWPSGMCSMEGSGVVGSAAEREELGCLRQVGDAVELDRSARDHYEHAIDPSAHGHPIGDQHRIRQVRLRVGELPAGADAADMHLECTLMDHIRPCRRHLSLSLSLACVGALFLLPLQKLGKEPQRRTCTVDPTAVTDILPRAGVKAG